MADDLPGRAPRPSYCLRCGTVWYGGPPGCPMCTRGAVPRGPHPDRVIYDEPPDETSTAAGLWQLHPSTVDADWVGYTDGTYTATIPLDAAVMENLRAAYGADVARQDRASSALSAAYAELARITAACRGWRYTYIPDSAQTVPHTCDEPGCPCPAGAAEAAARHAWEYGEDPGQAAAEQARQPAPLDTLDPHAPLLMAAGPGPEYWAWRHAALGVWIAAPGAICADVPPDDPAAALLTTAATVRALIARR